jgi:lipoprotein-anchoring transpeptidase ErfK/SrfK
MVRPSLATTLVIALVAMLALSAVALTQRARSQRQPAAQRTADTQQDAAAPRLQPTRGVAPAPRPAAAPKPPSYSVLRVRPGRRVELRARPGGNVLAGVGATTQFGSRSTLTVVTQKGGWLGVTSTDLPNGRLGWVKAKKGLVDQRRTRMAIRVDLSKRRLRLMDGRRVMLTATVGIGRPGSPTPTGRFAITDKLAGADYGPYYGCCMLALSGHQPHTPPGWQGGDRLAIHGTDAPSTIGVPASAGCLHADAADLKVLMRRVPLGTPVFISG